jgi:hypothetical protein
MIIIFGGMTGILLVVALLAFKSKNDQRLSKGRAEQTYPKSSRARACDDDD